MFYDPAQLDALRAAVSEGTFEAAARRLRVTPSAVSQRIRALENTVGRVLLSRSKPVEPTESGRVLLRLARQLDTLSGDVARELGAPDGDASGEPGSGGNDRPRVRVPIAVNADSLATWFLPPLARLAQQHPVVFELHRDDQDFTAALLESGTVMGAVTSRAVPIAGCRVSALGAMRYEAVATPAYVARWLPRRVDAGALAAAPLVDFDRRDDLQARWLTAMGADPGLPPRNFVPASSDFASATLLGLGWALLPTFQSAGPLAEGGLVRLGGPPIDVPLYWHQWNLRSPLLDAIADEIVAEGRRVLAPGVSRR